MNTITIYPGVTLSEIALGAGSLGSEAYNERGFEIMDRYLELGGFTFDTARIYAGGACDAALGKWLKTRGVRDKVTIVTKGSHPVLAPTLISRLSHRDITGDLEASLTEIGIDCSDLHMLHRDDVTRPVEEIMQSLHSLVKAGKTRSVGVSNWTATRIIQANAFARKEGITPLACSQAHYSLALTTAQTVGDLTYVPLNDIEAGWYRESGFPLLAFGAQARGWFCARARGATPTECPLKDYDLLPENHRRLERLIKLSQSTGRSLSSITTAYVRDSGLNAVALCAYSSIAQLEDSFGALEFTLDSRQISFLERGTLLGDA